MSTILDSRADTQAAVREQLAAATEPHTTSCQAIGDVEAPNHNDGEALHQHFGIPPLHKYLHRAEQNGAAVAKYPRAFVDMILYTNERDLEVLDAIAGEVDYDPRDPEPSHEVLERYPRYRAKAMEWVAADPKRVRDIRAVKGTDTFIHGEPGGGKTTLALSIVLWRMQLANETCIWAESVDESGTNERTEWLAFAPFATLAIPAGMDTEVRIVPEDVTVPEFTVDPEEIARDVIR